MSLIEEIKEHKNKETQRFLCTVLPREANYLVVSFRSEKEGNIKDIVIPSGSTTIAHYWTDRGYVVWRMYGPEGLLIGTVFHIAKNITITDRHVQYVDLMVDVWITPEEKMQVLDGLKRDAAPGVDGQRWRAYGENLEGNLKDLSERLKRGAYHAKPVRRVYIPKADGRQRPIGVPVLEDKIVQRATVDVLSAIYETDFVGFSYGFRPGRCQHDCLDALAVGITRMKVNWILDSDIRSFFDSVSHEWLIRFVERRVGDPRVIRLIGKWLKAGVMEDGVVKPTEVCSSKLGNRRTGSGISLAIGHLAQQLLPVPGNA